MDEYFGCLFEHSVPGLPEAAKSEGLAPLAYMRKYGAFEVLKTQATTPYEKPAAESGVDIDGSRRKVGFKTPSSKLELFSPTLYDWGWPEQAHCIPWTLESHVSPRNIERKAARCCCCPPSACRR